MKTYFLLILLLSADRLHAQELFVFTEPASNMAAKSIGLRLNNSFSHNTITGNNNYYLIPEVMVGVSKRLMVHGDVFFSNSSGNFTGNGASVYAKYRFYSKDEVHNHFRMAAYGRLGFNNTTIMQPAIDLYGINSGYEGGVIATQLIHKVALSASASFLHAMDNGNQKFLAGNENRNAMNYTFSVGKLMLPKEYINYNQTNVNLMAEFLGQTNLATGQSYLDIAPAIQLIFNSRTRIDIAYRCGLVKTIERTSSKSIFVRLEYNLFNAF